MAFLWPILPKWACKKGHEQVEWAETGGFEVYDEAGRYICTDDNRCWFCGQHNLPKE